jgi:glycosyltransferase involved in cell wall biosynthesis
MLDAAASGIPIVVSDTVGEKDRVHGNGRMYRENDVDSMTEALLGLASREARQALGVVGRRKMLDGFNWKRYAKLVEADYHEALKRSPA